MFQQDGAPPYWGSLVRDFLDKTFPDWKGWTNGLASALSRYYTLIFFFWGYIKDRVFATPIADVKKLKARIQAAVCTVTEDMLKNTWQELEYRLDILWLPRGHILKLTQVNGLLKNL
ncbi:hypothetical protein AVEN_137275-1 [Araneus ventricosus]|uniref:Uncharacterized protein n=1 Tax=Araneus ventricosus TaxID=182803 RepID=A0A4Y2DSA8_ARAVE|nr:hypothetical protein AVEN_137275-1 [Araneus ventricosus]